MKRQSPRLGRNALVGAASMVAFGFACTPSNNVPAGAPVITEMAIVESTPNGPAVTSIPSTVSDCPASSPDGAADGAADGAVGKGIDGEMCDPAVAICRQTTASNWCRCVPNSPPAATATTNACTDGGSSDAAVDAGKADAGKADAGVADASHDGATHDGAADAAAGPLGGTWNCAPFAPGATALFVFDRLLDTKPLDPGDAGGGVTKAAAVSFNPKAPSTSVTVTADYASNGTPNEVIFPLLGDFRSGGPSLLFSGQPGLPTSTAVTITLDGTQVRAKDGKTAFTGPGFFKNGSLTFTTAALSVSVTVPPPPALPADAGACTPAPTAALPDMTAAILTFNNPVDPAVIKAHVTITATPLGGTAATPVPFTAAATDSFDVSLTPVGHWPASSTIQISIDATTPDLIGDTLGATPPASFTTSAS